MSETTIVVQPTNTVLQIVEQNGEVGVADNIVHNLDIEEIANIEVLEVGVQGPSGGEDEMPLAKRVDFVTDLLIYRGEALPGALDASAVWRIRRLTLGLDDDVTEEWADGSADFNQIWDNRASLTYS